MLNKLFLDIKKYGPYSLVAAKAKLKAEVANSYFNWLWWILDPLCFMLIYTVIFGYIFDSKEPYFPVYIFIGLSMWNFFNKVLTASVKIVSLNKVILTRVYLPKYVLILIKMWVNGFKMLISFGVVAVMMLIFRIPITWNILFFIPILLILGLVTFGCSCFLMHYGVYVEDLSNVLNVVLRFMFYATGIFYNVSARIPQYGDMMVKLNPVASLIVAMRQGLLYGQTPDLLLLAAWLVFSLLLALAGIRKIYKEENNYAKAI